MAQIQVSSLTAKPSYASSLNDRSFFWSFLDFFLDELLCGPDSSPSMLPTAFLFFVEGLVVEPEDENDRA